MIANDNSLDPVVSDLRDLRDAMVRDDRIPASYFMRFGELIEEIEQLQDRLQATRRIS